MKGHYRRLNLHRDRCARGFTQSPEKCGAGDSKAQGRSHLSGMYRHRLLPVELNSSGNRLNRERNCTHPDSGRNRRNSFRFRQPHVCRFRNASGRRSLTDLLRLSSRFAWKLNNCNTPVGTFGLRSGPGEWGRRPSVVVESDHGQVFAVLHGEPQAGTGNILTWARAFSWSLCIQHQVNPIGAFLARSCWSPSRSSRDAQCAFCIHYTRAIDMRSCIHSEAVDCRHAALPMEGICSHNSWRISRLDLLLLQGER